MDLRLPTLKAISFYLLHNVSTLNQCRKLSCVTVVSKHFASYQGYPNYKWDLLRVKQQQQMEQVIAVATVLSAPGEIVKTLPKS
jgi:hypothetical protein